MAQFKLSPIKAMVLEHHVSLLTVFSRLLNKRQKV